MRYTNPSPQPPTRAAKARELGKTAVTFLLCSGFVAFGLAVMFFMPAGH